MSAETLTLTDAPAIRFPESGIAELPLRRGVNHVLVDVFDSEWRPNTFILDTGASYSVVTSHFQGRAEAALPSREIGGAVGVGGDLPVEAGTLSVRELRLGEVTIESFGALRMDIPGLDDYFERPIHGILGYNVLKDWLTVVDYRKEKVLLADPKRPDLLGWPDPSFVIPFQLHREAIVRIEGQVNGRTVTFVLDIGSSYTVFNEKAGQICGIEWGPDLDGVENGAAEDPTMDAGVAESLIVGPLAVVRTRVWRYEMPPFAAMGLGETPTAILGNDLLARFKVLIDYGRRELRLWNGR